MKGLFLILFLLPMKVHAGIFSYTAFPTSAAIITGGAVNNWNNPTNAESEDGIFASSNASVNTLRVSGFNFQIPLSATILGIEADIKEQGVSFVIDNQVVLYNADGTTTSSNLAKGVDWSTTLGYVVYGGSSTLWGLTPTPSLINSSGFGVGVSATKDSGGVQVANIDVIKMTITANAPTTIYNGTIYNGTLH